MSTFKRSGGGWPVGYFRAYSGWILRHRRTIQSRVSTLNAEIDKIGMIRVEYRSVSSPNGVMKTEERVGVSVTEGSTLEKLMQAYIANGGNPLDVSSMMYPQSSNVFKDEDEDGIVYEEYPNSGVISPATSRPNEPMPSNVDTGYGVYPGGMPESGSYFPARQCGRISPGSFDYNAVSKTMNQIRGWANQDIKEMLSEMEARIIKQCDLREQLITERDEVLVQAFGGVVNGVMTPDPDQFDINLMVQNLIQDMSETIYEKDSNGMLLAPRHRSDAFIQPFFPTIPSDINAELSV